MTYQDIAQLVHTLGKACGFPLFLVDDSVVVDGDYIAATARSRESTKDRLQLNLEMLAKIFVAPTERGIPDVWALLLFYINGVRVAPAGGSYMRLKLERSDEGGLRWVAAGWEVDEFGEWLELEKGW